MVERNKQPFRKQKIAEQHAGFILPDFVDAQKAPPNICLVNNVIMNEGCGVQQLNHSRSNVASIGDIPK